MSEKAEWKPLSWKGSAHPEREHDYLLFEILVTPHGRIIAQIEQFAMNERCFYANTLGINGERSGCLGTHEWARQWCEAKTGNKVN